MQETRETQVQSLDQENPLEKQMATYSSLENPMDRGAWQATIPWDLKELDTYTLV